MKKILFIEDDQSLGATLFQRLSKDYQVIWKQSVTEGWTAFLESKDIDVVILDVGLPDGNGFDLAKKIKAESSVPFLFLTAQSDAESRLEGFELGAEEFIPKPFHLKELLIRLNHVLEQHVQIKEYHVDYITINFTDMSIKNKDGKIEYPSVTDMKLLKLLIDSHPKHLTRDKIIDAIWGEDKMISHRTIDNTVVRLRHLLNDSSDRYIRSIRGVGYQWAYTSQTEENT